MATVCPYCNIEVSESSIEAEDGCCPECGSVISATSSFMGSDDREEFDEDGEHDDIFADLDDDEDIFDRSEFSDDGFDDEDLDEEFEDEEFDEEDVDEDF